MTRRVERRHLVDRNAADPFQGHHPARRALPIDGGDAEILVAHEIVGHLGGGGGLEAQIHFLHHRVGEGPHRLGQMQAPRRRHRALDHLGHPAEQLDIAGEFGLDAGPENLDGDHLALGGDGEMHWAIEAAATGVSSKLA